MKRLIFGLLILSVIVSPRLAFAAAKEVPFHIVMVSLKNVNPGGAKAIVEPLMGPIAYNVASSLNVLVNGSGRAFEHPVFLFQERRQGPGANGIVKDATTTGIVTKEGNMHAAVQGRRKIGGDLLTNRAIPPEVKARYESFFAVGDFENALKTIHDFFIGGA